MNVRVSTLDKWRPRSRECHGGPLQAEWPVTCDVSAFTLLELLTVIAIIGLLAVLAAPIFKQFSKGDVTLAATRQLRDDLARARQLAISRRSTVYVVFIPTNFWNDALRTGTGGNAWSDVTTYALPISRSTVVTQMYAGQWCGYYMESLRNIGDQPGRGYPQDLLRVRTLPAGSYIAPFKFTAPLFYGPNSNNVPYPTNRLDLPIYGFLTASNIPFPTADLLTNPTYVTQMKNQGFNYVTVPYVAFNYLGQLTPGDGSLLPYDENIPIEYGTIMPAYDPSTKSPIQGLPTVTEMVPGNSTNVSYNVIHIDHLTGRARLEQQELQ